MDSTAEKSATATRLEVIANELELWEQQKPLIEKHNDTISSLSFSLAKLIESDKEQPKSTLGPYPRLDDTELNLSPTPQPISTIALRQTITVTTPNQPPSDPMQYRPRFGLPHSVLSTSQIRTFAARNAHHINYPVIPRYRDRARLRRLHAQSMWLPSDLPPWSVRAQVPIVQQPDVTEDNRWLTYDGFSINLLVAYEKEMEENKVPLIPIPYTDDDMKRILVEKGVFTQEEVEGLVEYGSETWRGPMEYQDDLKHLEEMEDIMTNARR